jgi:peroxiredoxin
MQTKTDPFQGVASFQPSWMLAACYWLLSITLLTLTSITYSSERPSIPDISYPDLSGKKQNLQQWKGQVLLLNFWASWCAPCLSEIKYLKEYQQKFGPSGLQVIGLGIDQPRKLSNVKRSLQINYPILLLDENRSRSTLKAWGNDSGMIPFTVIFDKSGRFVTAHRGIIDEQLFNTRIKPLLSLPAE